MVTVFEVIFMSHIYWELHEIPRPAESYINHSDGRVYLMTRSSTGKKTRKVIGHATSETMMHPNDMYKFLYPALWEEHYSGNKTLPHILNAGMYSLSLGIGYSNGLYPLLHEAYGPVAANMLMDYADFSMLERSDVSQLYPDRMARELVFSREVYSDAWISEFFRSKMSEDENHRFRTGWLEACRKRGINKVWLSIDGSNNDCSVQKSELPQKGKSKSGNSTDIVSYLYALDADSGIPVTYFVSDGSMADCKAFQKMIEFLSRAQMEIEGIILDRGFCTHDVIKRIRELGYKYVIMMCPDTNAHACMMESHAEEIFWKVRHCISGSLFGIQEGDVKLFKSHDDTAYVTLFFDGLNGSQRSVTLNQKILDTVKELRQGISNGKVPSVPSKMRKYLSVAEKDGSLIVQINYDEWQDSINGKGYSSIAASFPCQESEVNRIYHLRDVSETQFSILKSQLGYDVTRVHYTEGIENKFAACFIASIIRSEIVNACKRQGLDANRMIQEMDRIALALMPDGIYSAIDSLTGRQKQLLSEFGLDFESLRLIAYDVNRRKDNPINSQIHAFPGSPKELPKRGRPPKSKTETIDALPKRKPGRPKGSKNKKTLQKKADGEAVTKTKRGRGRPKGSKNKPKANPTSVKRGRGRPRKTEQ